MGNRLFGCGKGEDNFVGGGELPTGLRKRPQPSTGDAQDFHRRFPQPVKNRRFVKFLAWLIGSIMLYILAEVFYRGQ